MNSREVEIRIALSEGEKETLIANLENMGWQAKTSSQDDTYFCAQHFADEGKTKECPYVVRIRQQKKGCALTYKSFTGDGSWMEIESGISDPAAMRAILEKLGQCAYLHIAKARQKGVVRNIEVNIDDIAGLGSFVEMEILSDDVPSGRAALLALAKELGLQEERVVTKGYVQLMEEQQRQG